MYVCDAHSHTCMYAYIHIDSWMCVHALMPTYMHAYTHTDMVDTSIHGDRCTPNSDIQADTHVDDKHTYIQVIHFSLETYNLRDNCCHNFQICIFPVIPYYLYGGSSWTIHFIKV